MMNNQLLRDSVELLKSVRTELQGKVEDSVISELDKAIQDLEIVQQDDSKEYNALDILFTLGRVLEHLPTTVKIVKHLMRLL